MDECGVTQKPSIRSTWAPCGQTPVIVHAFNWQKLSVAAALGYHWGGQRSRLFCRTRPGSYDAASLIGFLRAFQRERPGRRCLLIWDGLPAHKSRLMQAHLRAQRSWLEVESLPAYAPELNPVELLWGNVKGQELANLCAADLSQVGRRLRRGLRRVAVHRTLPQAFLRHAGLPL